MFECKILKGTYNIYCRCFSYDDLEKMKKYCFIVKKL